MQRGNRARRTSAVNKHWAKAKILEVYIHFLPLPKSFGENWVYDRKDQYSVSQRDSLKQAPARIDWLVFVLLDANVSVRSKSQ